MIVPTHDRHALPCGNDPSKQRQATTPVGSSKSGSFILGVWVYLEIDGKSVLYMAVRDSGRGSRSSAVQCSSVVQSRAITATSTVLVICVGAGRKRYIPGAQPVRGRSC